MFPRIATDNEMVLRDKNKKRRLLACQGLGVHCFYLLWPTTVTSWSTFITITMATIAFPLKIPDFRSIRDSIRNVLIDNSLLSSLDGNSLRDLPLVETVSFVNNSITYVDPDVFQVRESPDKC
ncbi:hypothetical protein TNCV_4355091 [Trichonephila clavipes]|nr:hypothetical protein TNCV_4355091 [Trichonephila clavipes]